MPRKDLLAAETLPAGRSRYRDSYPGLRETQARIYVKIRPEGIEASFYALLDTGAPFCLLNESVAELLRDHLTEGLGSITVQTAYGPANGELYRHQITLIADEGESLDIEATVFVPTGWQGPCFLGYSGVLDRVFFAVNPELNLFYFRALGG